MRLNSLQLTNFRQHADTRLEFDLGLTGIIGPNGAGKSTVLEAIAWALYGQSAVRGTRDSIRNVRAGARAPVRVHPLMASRAGRLAGDFGFERATHRYRLSLGTGMTVLVAVGLAVEAVSGLPALAWLSLATAVAFPLGRLYDYAVTIRSGRPARELRRILEGS